MAKAGHKGQRKLKFQIKTGKHPKYKSIAALKRHGAIQDPGGVLRLTKHQMDYMKQLNEIMNVLFEYRRKEKNWKLGSNPRKSLKMEKRSTRKLIELAEREAGFQTINGWKNNVQRHHAPIRAKAITIRDLAKKHKEPVRVLNELLKEHKNSLQKINFAIKQKKPAAEIINLKEKFLMWEFRVNKEANRLKERLKTEKKIY